MGSYICCNSFLSTNEVTNPSQRLRNICMVMCSEINALLHSTDGKPMQRYDSTLTWAWYSSSHSLTRHCQTQGTHFLLDLSSGVLVNPVSEATSS